MAAQTQLNASTILDLSLAVKTTSATIGVDRFFAPLGFDRSQPGVAKWCDRSGGIPVGYPTFTLSVREPTKASNIYKVTAKMDLPTLEQTSPSTATGIQPAPTKAYSCQANLEFLLPNRSSLAERQALLRAVASLFHATINANDDSPTNPSNSPVIAAVETFEPVW